MKNKKRKKKSPFCGNKDFKLTDKKRDTEAMSMGMTGGTHNFIMHEKLWICNKCQCETWTDEDLSSGRQFCTQR
tara:strand:- start:306 stop:527 length:222 start_codon:yes stop_codon:yes gene_type:complete